MPPLFFTQFWQQIFSIFQEMFNDFHFKILNRKPLFFCLVFNSKTVSKIMFFYPVAKIINFEKPSKTLLFTYKAAISQFPISARIQNQAFGNQHGKCIENSSDIHQKSVEKLRRLTWCRLC